MHSIALYQLGGAQDDLHIRYGPLTRWCTIWCHQSSCPGQNQGDTNSYHLIQQVRSRPFQQNMTCPCRHAIYHWKAQMPNCPLTAGGHDRVLVSMVVAAMSVCGTFILHHFNGTELSCAPKLHLMPYKGVWGKRTTESTKEEFNELWGFILILRFST